MTEQVLRKRGDPTADSKQNDGYVRHTDPAETSRDFSKPLTIPADEYEEATGESHEEAVTTWRANEAARKAKEAQAAAA